MMNLVTEILLLTGLGALSALLLVITRNRLEPKTTSLITLINSQLPQTQCAQCGYPGCKPYAEAIADGEIVGLVFCRYQFSSYEYQLISVMLDRLIPLQSY